jgi:hypothetical protein
MPVGLIVRAVAVFAGIIAMAILARLAHLSQDDADSAMLAYILIAAIYLGYFIAEYAGETPPRSNRR